MNKSDDIYIEHILTAIAKIKRYTRNGESAFMSSEMAQDAVVRQFEIIGEAVKNISAEIKARYPEVPWKAAAANRDRMIHGYFTVNLKRVWRTTIEDIPGLEQQMRRIGETFGIDPESL